MDDKKGKKKASVSDSKNVIQDSNFRVDGNFHVGDIYYNTPPPADTDLDEIRNLIGKNRVEKAITALQAVARAQGADSYEEIQLLANQWENLQRESRLGIVSYDQATTRRNQIVHQLLLAVKALEKPRDGNG